MTISLRQLETNINQPKISKKNSETLLELKDVSKVYGSGAITAVKDVNLNVEKGEFISFVGPSGCGKSTVFKIIAGLSAPTTGKVTFSNLESPDALGKVNISYVFQDSTLLPWCSVIENVALPLKLMKVDKKERRERAENALKLVGLSDYKKALPRQLSGGMKMRVSIARALINKPSLLLMDEPFGALDEITRQSLQEELLSIWKNEKDMTILFVTHNVFEAAYLSTKVVTMSSRPGRISEQLNLPTSSAQNENFRSSDVFNKIVNKISQSLNNAL